MAKIYLKKVKGGDCKDCYGYGLILKNGIDFCRSKYNYNENENANLSCYEFDYNYERIYPGRSLKTSTVKSFLKNI